MKKFVGQKCNVVFVIIFFATFVIIPQVIQLQGTTKRSHQLLPVHENISEESDIMIALKCLKDLKNPDVRLKFQDALRNDTQSMLLSLMEYLPNCAKHPPKQFIAHFIKLTVNTLDDAEKEELEFESPWPNRIHLENKTISNLCPEIPPLLQGKINITFSKNGEIVDKQNAWNWPPTLEEIALEYQDQTKIGGFYKPPNCDCRGFSALIIPFRDREQHLRYFLHYTHDLLWRQQLCYVIIVVEQGDDKTFNKGQLMNTGFYFAKNLSNSIDCFIFHDVDIIAEDDRIIYTCRGEKTSCLSGPCCLL